MLDTQCSFVDKGLKDRTASIINNYIEEKEIELTQKHEEYANLPNRYIIKEVIKKEIDILTEQINSMRKTVGELECSNK